EVSSCFRGSVAIADFSSPVGSTFSARVFSTPSDIAWLMVRRVSSSSASRTSSSMPLRNSFASLRPVRSSCAPVRIAFGSSLGPSTRRATTTRMAICDQLRSNMTRSRRPAPAYRRRVSAGGFILAADIGLDGLVAARLARLGLILQALFEGGDALAHILHQLRDLAPAAENQQHHCQKDEQVPNAERSHPDLLETQAPRLRADYGKKPSRPQRTLCGVVGRRNKAES